MEHTEPEASDGNEAAEEREIDSCLTNASSNLRFEAFFLDFLFYVVLVYVIGSVLNRYGIDRGEDWAFCVIAPVPYWIGFVALGVTPASWLCDIRIVDGRNRAPGLRRAFRRSLVPGTIWVLLAFGAALFDPRIDAIVEANPRIEGVLFWVGGVALMSYFGVYCYKLQSKTQPTFWHDAIAGTRVIEHRGARKAVLVREWKEIRKRLDRVGRPQRHGVRFDQGARLVNRADEED
jgi:hypothetical protein